MLAYIKTIAGRSAVTKVMEELIEGSRKKGQRNKGKREKAVAIFHGGSQKGCSKNDAPACLQSSTVLVIALFISCICACLLVKVQSFLCFQISDRIRTIIVLVALRCTGGAVSTMVAILSADLIFVAHVSGYKEAHPAPEAACAQISSDMGHSQNKCVDVSRFRRHS